MLQEMKLEDALKKFLQERKVLVMYDETLEADKPAFTGVYSRAAGRNAEKKSLPG